MALADELKDYITKNAKTSTTITQNHNVAIVGETHARLSSEEPNIRTTAAVRLLLELLKEPRYRYFANESYLNAGPVRVGVRNYLRDKSLPPKFDPKHPGTDTLEIAPTRLAAPLSGGTGLYSRQPALRPSDRNLCARGSSPRCPHGSTSVRGNRGSPHVARHARRRPARRGTCFRSVRPCLADHPNVDRETRVHLRFNPCPHRF